MVGTKGPPTLQPLASVTGIAPTVTASTYGPEAELEACQGAQQPLAKRKSEGSSPSGS